MNPTDYKFNKKISIKPKYVNKSLLKYNLFYIQIV